MIFLVSQLELECIFQGKEVESYFLTLSIFIICKILIKKKIKKYFENKKRIGSISCSRRSIG